MTAQLPLFAALEEEARKESALDRLCGWRPAPGDWCMVAAVGTRREADGVRGYWYGERAVVIEGRPGPEWVVEIRMGLVWGKPWHKDGTRLSLGPGDIGPWYRDVPCMTAGEP